MFLPKIAQNMPHKLCKISAQSSQRGSAAISEKLMEGCITPPPTFPAQARVKLVATLLLWAGRVCDTRGCLIPCVCVFSAFVCLIRVAFALFSVAPGITWTCGCGQALMLRGKIKPGKSWCLELKKMQCVKMKKYNECSTWWVWYNVIKENGEERKAEKKKRKKSPT